MFILVSCKYPSCCKLILARTGELTSRQTTVSDLIQISPEDFSKYSAVAIEDNINEKYANKVWSSLF